MGPTKHTGARELSSRRDGWRGLSPVSLDLSKSSNEPPGLKRSLSSPLRTMLLFKGEPLIHTDSFQMELTLSNLLSLPLLILTGLPSSSQTFTHSHHRAFHSESSEERGFHVLGWASKGREKGQRFVLLMEEEEEDGGEEGEEEGHRQG